MVKKRTTFWYLTAFILAAATMACAPRDSNQGGGSDEKPESSPPFGDALRYDPARSVNDGEAITLEFWSQVDYEPVYSRLIEEYRVIHPNVEIRLSSLSWDDHRNRLYAALNSGIGPDLIHLHNAMSSQVISHLAPYPPDRFSLLVMEQDFRQVRSHLVDGHLYFLDTGLMTGAIFYNTDHWREEGLDENDFPKTWDELAELAQRLTRYDESGGILRSGFNPNGMGFALLTALNLQQGLPMFAVDEPRRPLLDSEETLRSLEYLQGFYREPATADPYLPEAHEAFGFGKASMIYAWGWALNWMDNNAPDLDYGVFPLPTWNGEIPPAYDRNNGEISMGVNRYSSAERRDAAFDLIAFYLARDEFLLDLGSRFGTYPSKRSLESRSGILENPRLSPFRAILERTVWPGPLPLTYEEHVAKYIIDPVILDGADPSTALSTGASIITPVMRYEDFISREKDYPYFDEFRF